VVVCAADEFDAEGVGMAVCVEEGVVDVRGGPGIIDW